MGAGEIFALRKAAQDMVQKAIQVGMEEAWRLPELTLREIGIRFSALAAQRQQQAEQADLHAWLVGRYVLTAMHAPRRYPRRPDAVAHPPKKMTDKQMKQFFADLSAGKGAENGDR